MKQSGTMSVTTLDEPDLPGRLAEVAIDSTPAMVFGSQCNEADHRRGIDNSDGSHALIGHEDSRGGAETSTNAGRARPSRGECQ